MNPLPIVLFFYLDAALTAALGGMTGDFVAPKTLALHIAVCFAAACWTLSVTRTAELRLARSPLFMPAAMLLAAHAVSALNAPVPYLSARSLDLLLPCFFIMVFAASVYGGDKPARTVLRWLALLGFLMAAHGIAQYFGLDFMAAQTRYHQSGKVYMRVYSTFGNPALLAEFLAPLIIAATALVPEEKSPFWRRFSLFAAVVMAVCVMLTRSRTAPLALVCGACVFIALYLLIRGANRMKTVTVAVALVVAIAAGAWTVASRAELMKYVSVEQRKLHWSVTWDMFRHSPFTGVGSGNFRFVYLKAQSDFFKRDDNVRKAPFANWEKPRHAHNSILETAAETGVPGLASLALLFGVFVWHGVRKTLREVSFMRAGIFAAALTFMLETMTGLSDHIPVSAALLWLLMGLNAPETAPGEPAEMVIRFEPPRLGWELVGVTLLAIVFVMGCSVNIFRAEALEFTGKRLIAAERPMEAVVVLSESIELNPWEGETWFTRGAAFAGMGFYEKAIMDFRKAAETTDDPILHYNLAMSHFSSGQVGAAFEDATVMEEMLPAHALPKTTLAQLYVAVGNFEAARKKMAEAEIMRKFMVIDENTAERMR